MILFFVRKLVCGLLRPPSVVILFALCYPSCVEVIVEIVLVSLLCSGDCGGCVGIPLSVEVIEVGVLALCLSL